MNVRGAHPLLQQFPGSLITLRHEPCKHFHAQSYKKHRDCITKNGMMTISLLPTLSGFTYTEKWRVTENVIFCPSKLWVQLWARIFHLCWPTLSQAMPWHSFEVRLLKGPIWLWNWVQLSQFWGLNCLLAHVCLTLCQVSTCLTY